MKQLIALFVFLVSVIGVSAQQGRCLRAEFSGEARQGDPFTKDLGAGITFSVIPMRLREDRRMGWFQIRILGAEESGFVFNISDRNWLLADGEFWGVFIGGADTDLAAALRYRSRYLLFPISLADKDKARQAAVKVSSAATSEENSEALTLLRSAKMGHLRFELTDYGVGSGDPPMSVEWVRFNATVFLPPNFLVSNVLPVTVVDCPQIPAEVIENIRDPKRHDYVHVNQNWRESLQ